jgi:hypothetical protein
VAEDFKNHDGHLPALRPEECLSLGQGVFYLATGIWPLLSMRSFEQVTGAKVDKWLVKTAGVLITAIGSALTLAGARRNVSAETRVLAVASAAGLTAIDLVYVAKRRIAPVYLLDAVVELALIGGWIVTKDRVVRVVSGDATDD